MGQPGIIDILTAVDPYLFTVDTALTEVTIAMQPWNSLLSNGSGDQYFEIKDNLIIESVALRLPYCFTVSTDIPLFSLRWQDQLGALQLIPELGTEDLKVPLPDVEIPLSTYAPMSLTGALATKQGISCVQISINISMIGVPDSLDEAELPLDLMLKVRHTLPMIP